MLVRLPRGDRDQPLLRRIRELEKEEMLHDIELLSDPVVGKMLCGHFSERSKKQLKLMEVDKEAFAKVLNVWCGSCDEQDLGMEEVLEMAMVADRFEISNVVSAIEEALIEYLSLENCGNLMMYSNAYGMLQLRTEALKITAKRFEEFATTSGFMLMDEEALGSVVDDDGLVTTSEETVWEAVVKWMRGAGSRVGWRGVVQKIRFPLMREEYLRTDIVGMVDGEDGKWISGVVDEALRAKAARQAGAKFDFELLGRKAMVDRVGLGVRWEEFVEGGEQRLKGHLNPVLAFAASDDWVCSSAWDESILVWDRASNRKMRSLLASTHDLPTGDWAISLSAWEGRLISGHVSGMLRLWNVRRGKCEHEVRGHDDASSALVVSGAQLASGGGDGSLKLWRLKAGGAWTCERSLLGHTDSVQSLVVWQRKLVSASMDESIRVWDLGTGALDATLAGHDDGVTALAVHRDRLLSASLDGTIRAWAMGTWAPLERFAVAEQGIRSLVVSGSKLVSGSTAAGEDAPAELQVWGLEELDLQATFLLSGCDEVNSLLALDREVWVATEKDVVVWAQRP